MLATTLIVIVIKNKYFVINKFSFINDESLKYKYTLKEYLVALAPLNIIQEGIKDYDKFK